MRSRVIQLLVVCPALWLGCSSNRDSFSSRPREFSEVDGGDAGCSGVTCSQDLRSIRDCDGNIVEECAIDKACGRGKCIEPCEAAAANEGSVGCSFVIPGQNSGALYGSRCAAVFVANTSAQPATIRLEFEGEDRSLDGAVWVPVVENGVVKHRKLDGPIPTGSGAVVFLSSDFRPESDWVGCPSEAKTVFDREPTIPATGIGHVALLRSDVPIAMYSMYPYGGASSYIPSATLLYPISSFRKNYVAATTWGGSGDMFGGTRGGQTGMPTLQIVATEDDTSVNLLPTVNIVGGNGLPSELAHEVAHYTLQRGEVMQLTQNADLVGSVIESSKPVGVFGGGSCMRIPSGVFACDTDNVQIPPLSAWGSEYVVLPPPNRSLWRSRGAEAEQDPGVVRLVGAVDDTNLSYEPVVPDRAPGKLDSGQMERFFVSEPFVVRSQDSAHPFYAASIMTGSNMSTTRLGDPETAIVIPPAQWLDSYVFFSDSSFNLSAVFVIRRKHSGEFRDVVLDCAGTLTGWKAVTADYEWTHAELSRFGAPVSYAEGTCTDGAHRIRSDGPFSMTIWGISADASYSYPGGSAVRTITDVHLPVNVH